MAELHSDLTVIDSGHRRTIQDPASWASAVCPECGPSSFLIVGSSQDETVRYLRCVTCRRGLVLNRGVFSPGATRLQIVDGCPDDVAAAWAEVRADLAAGAWTSAVMMCRKILFHIAVEEGLPAQSESGRAPTFKECLNRLRSEGLLTPRQEPWVQNIKDVGNQANHELDPISEEAANRVATFTRQLLVTAYEMPHKMKAVLGVEDEMGEADEG